VIVPLINPAINRGVRNTKHNIRTVLTVYILIHTTGYTYVLRSRKDKKLYYGYTENLKLRIERHNNARVHSTKYRIPLELVYYEACKLNI
jgi:hypothetical protein